MQVDLNKEITHTADALATKSLNFRNKVVKVHHDTMSEKMKK